MAKSEDTLIERLSIIEGLCDTEVFVKVTMMLE